MRNMLNIILSPYFTSNTKLVANFCRSCYLEEQKEDTIVTAVNTRFLKIYDPEQYKIVESNLRFISDIKLKVSCLKDKEEYSINKKHLTVSKSNHKYNRYWKLMKMKRNIMKKYLKFDCKRKNFDHFQRSRKLRDHRKSGDTLEYSKMELQNLTSNYPDWIPKIKVEDIDKQLEDQLFKRKQFIMEKRNLKSEIKEEDEEQKFIKRNEENQLPKSVKFQDTDIKTKWIPPISPHNLVEETYYNDPWALLVVTIFLNKTSCSVALPYMNKFFEDFKGPYDVLKVEACSLEPYFTKLGLIRTRAYQVWRMSHDYIHKDWKNVRELYGVGKYAEDAYKMFHIGDFNVQPTDRYLKIYKAWYEMTLRNEKLGIYESNSQVYLEDYFVATEDEDRNEGADEKPN